MRRNRLLRILPQAEASVLGEILQPLRLSGGQTIQEAGDALRYVYFPAESLLSTTIVMRDGSAVECHATGCDGVFGNRFTTEMRAPGRTFCQVPGDAFRARPKQLFSRMAEMPVLRQLIYRYGQCVYMSTAQLVACNSLHSIAQRTARWLLITRDALGRDEFDLTQEFLADMLGVRRASVTTAMGMLQRSGAIRYRRGCMTIVRPRALERAACECYRVLVENRRLVTANVQA